MKILMGKTLSEDDIHDLEKIFGNSIYSCFYQTDSNHIQANLNFEKLWYDGNWKISVRTNDNYYKKILSFNLKETKNGCSLILTIESDKHKFRGDSFMFWRFPNDAPAENTLINLIFEDDHQIVILEDFNLIIMKQ